MKIRVVMGVALIIVALITLCKINAVGPFGILGTARGLEGGMLALGVIANFILGILMTAGIGLYAPCMAIVLLLGMSADVAFPVMMGSCAYLCPACGITFIREGKYNRASTIPMIITGSIGVLIAGFIVTSLPPHRTYIPCLRCHGDLRDHVLPRRGKAEEVDKAATRKKRPERSAFFMPLMGLEPIWFPVRF